MFEVEQKFRVAGLAAIEATLRGMGAAFHEPVEQVDRYFAHPGRDFGQTDEALRIRQVGARNFITYKGPKIDRATKTRREIELPLPEGQPYAEQFAELLAALSFAEAGVVRKVRRTAALHFQERRFEAALDQVADLGSFVELETAAEESQLDAARDCLLALSARLGLTGAERRSYLELLLDAPRRG